jgi:hypothetical protein
VVGVVLREEVVVLVKIAPRMKVVIAVVVNNAHNVLINLKDNKHQMSQVVLNKVVKHGETNLEMILNQVVVFADVVVVEAVEIMKVAEEVVVVAAAGEISKEVEAVVAVDVAILITEVLKKVHSNNNNKHKKLVDGNKVPSMSK